MNLVVGVGVGADIQTTAYSEATHSDTGCIFAYSYTHVNNRRCFHPTSPGQRCHSEAASF